MGSLCLTCGRSYAFIRLPRLSCVYLGDVGSNVLTFFAKHGAKIRNLDIQSYGDLPVLDLCPALTFLTIRWAYVVGLVCTVVRLDAYTSPSGALGCLFPLQY